MDWVLAKIGISDDVERVEAERRKVDRRLRISGSVGVDNLIILGRAFRRNIVDRSVSNDNRHVWRSLIRAITTPALHHNGSLGRIFTVDVYFVVASHFRE